MVVAKYTENLYASEVYRELERHAVRKGQFEPTDEERVKLAAQKVNQTRKINEPVNTDQTDDLIQDVARLAFAMRRKGFITQAEDLEQKLVLYKQAESAMYGVTPETNKDFIGFAHRDGDVEIVEGSGELGVIETIDSLAKKIRALTEKEPSGKLPGKSASLEELAAFVKMAATEFAETYQKVNAKIDQFPDLSNLGLNFRGQNLIENEGARKLYSALTNVPDHTILRAGQGYELLKNAGITKSPPDRAAFLAFIKANFNSADNIRNLARQLGADVRPLTTEVAGQYRLPDGSLYNTLADVKAKFPDWDYSKIPARSDPSSIWGVIINKSTTAVVTLNMAGKTAEPGGWYLIENKANNYAEHLRSTFYNKFSDPAYGAYFKVLDGADAKVAALPDTLQNNIRAVRVNDPESVRDPETEVLNIDAALKPLSDAQAAITKILDGNEGKWAISALTYLGHEPKATAIGAWRNELLKTTLPQAQAAVTKSADTIDVSQAITYINQAIRLWQQAAQLIPRDTSFQSRSKANIKKVRGVLNTLSATGLKGDNNKPKDQLLAKLEPLGYSTFDELLSGAEQLMGVAQGDYDVATEKSGQPGKEAEGYGIRAREPKAEGA